MSKTSKYDITILKNKAEYNGQKMSIMNFKHKDKTKVERKDMVNFCNEILKSYRKKYADGIEFLRFQSSIQIDGKCRCYI